METPKLRPFTQHDWNAYSGCESDAPLIADVPGHDADVVVDGDQAEICFYDGSDDQVWLMAAGTHEAAVRAAEAVLADPRCIPEFFRRII